jgi:hypothetical protein
MYKMPHLEYIRSLPIKSAILQEKNTTIISRNGKVE